MPDSFFHDHSVEPAQGDGLGEHSLSQSDTQRPAGKESLTEEEGRIAAIMAYIPFLCFIPLLNMRGNKEAQFHARQGVVLFIIELLAGLFLIDGIADFVFKAVLIAAVAFSLAGIYFVLQGKRFRLPVISDIADKSKL